MDRDLLEKRWNHHEEKRKEKLRLVTEERKRILEEEKQGVWKPMKSVMLAANTSGLSHKIAGDSLMKSSQVKGNSVVVTDSAMLDRERKQLEKIKLKQQQELQQMMEYELKMQQIRQLNEEKMKKQQEREEQHRRELALKAQQQEELNKQHV